MVRVGHRGAAGHAPENTLKAVERAIELGVDFVEVDVRRSKDGELVIFHDARVDRTTDGRGAVRDLTLKQLRQLTIAGSQRIPTLSEILKNVEGRAGLFLEIKEEGLSDQVWEQVGASRFSGPVVYMSFFHGELLRIRKRAASAQTLALLEGVPVKAAAFALDARATHVGLAFDSLSARFIQTLHAARLQVFTYTVNDPADIATARALGVDGIISDFPDRI